MYTCMHLCMLKIILVHESVYTCLCLCRYMCMSMYMRVLNCGVQAASTGDHRVCPARSNISSHSLLHGRAAAWALSLSAPQAAGYFSRSFGCWARAAGAAMGASAVFMWGLGIDVSFGLGCSKIPRFCSQGCLEAMRDAWQRIATMSSVALSPEGRYCHLTNPRP